MQKLIEAGLFGDGLVDISTKELVGRYNGCLVRLGIEETKLKRFRVDGIGWSPEIAEEKGNPLYLSAGVANPMAIIIRPEQIGKPVYFSSWSFIRRMMTAYCEKYSDAIANLSVDVCLGLDLDEGILVYNEPSDLCLVERIVVKTEGNGLIRAAKEQNAMVVKLTSGSMSWADYQLRAKIMESAKKWGDLRFKQMEIEPFEFTDFRSFFTPAFGGVFVLRYKRSKCILVGLDHAGTSGMISIDDGKLLDRLMDESLLELNKKWWREHPDQIEFLMECILAHAVSEHVEDLDLSCMTATQKKRLLVECSSSLKKQYDELERYRKWLKNGGKEPKLSKKTKSLLLRPKSRMRHTEQEVIWQLLLRVQPIDVLALYTYDKNLFYERYQQWSESLKRWAVDVIKRNYVPLMEQN